MMQIGIGLGILMSAGRRVASPVISITSGGGYAGSVYTSTIAGQWTADDVDISGETGATFTMTAAIEGAAIRCGSSNSLKVGIPSDLSTVRRWYAARSNADFVLSGTRITSWIDRMGVENAIQETGGLQPFTETHNSVFSGRFDFDYLQTSTDISGVAVGNASIFTLVAGRGATPQNKVNLSNETKTNTINLLSGKYNDFSMTSSADSTVQSNTYANGPWFSSGWRQNGNAIRTRSNGVQTGSQTIAAASSAALRLGIGDFWDGSGQATNSNVADVVVATGALSDADFEFLEGYAHHAYGLASLLPSDHPRKLASSMVTS